MLPRAAISALRRRAAVAAASTARCVHSGAGADRLPRHDRGTKKAHPPNTSHPAPAARAAADGLRAAAVANKRGPRDVFAAVPFTPSEAPQPEREAARDHGEHASGGGGLESEVAHRSFVASEGARDAVAAARRTTAAAEGASTAKEVAHGEGADHGEKAAPRAEPKLAADDPVAHYKAAAREVAEGVKDAVAASREVIERKIDDHKGRADRMSKQFGDGASGVAGQAAAASITTVSTLGSVIANATKAIAGHLPKAARTFLDGYRIMTPVRREQHRKLMQRYPALYGGSDFEASEAAAAARQPAAADGSDSVSVQHPGAQLPFMKASSDAAAAAGASVKPLAPLA